MVAAGVSVDVDCSGPFVGGGYRWSIAFKAVPSLGREETPIHASIIPTIGVQQANLTGTGVRVRVEKRDAYEAAAAEQLVVLAAPLPPVTAEVQTIGCYLTEGLTPSLAAKGGEWLTLEFRGETTEVRQTTLN